MECARAGERSSALAPGTRREVPAGAHIPGTSSGPTCVCRWAAATLGRLWRATCHRRRILPQNPDKKLHCIKMHFPPPGWGISPKCYNIHSTKECLETFSQTKPSRIQGFHIFKICYVGEIAMKLSKVLNFWPVSFFYSVVLYSYYCICNVLLYYCICNVLLLFEKHSNQELWLWPNIKMTNYPKNLTF